MVSTNTPTSPSPACTPRRVALDYQVLPTVIVEADEVILKPLNVGLTPMGVPLLLKGPTPMAIYDILRQLGLPKDAALRARGYGPIFLQSLGCLAFGSRIVAEDYSLGNFTAQFCNLVTELVEFSDSRDDKLYSFTSQIRASVFDIVSLPFS
jgi:hypothetical protein